MEDQSVKVDMSMLRPSWASADSGVVGCPRRRPLAVFVAMRSLWPLQWPYWKGWGRPIPAVRARGPDFAIPDVRRQLTPTHRACATQAQRGSSRRTRPRPARCAV